MTFGPPNTLGSYLINNLRWSKDWETFLTQITKAYSDIARSINTRDIAIYDLIKMLMVRNGSIRLMFNLKEMLLDKSINSQVLVIFPMELPLPLL